MTADRVDGANASGAYVSLPVGLVARVILALDRDILSRPSRDEKVPGVEHDCEMEDGERVCDLLHDQWVTTFEPHPLAQQLRDALPARGDSAPGGAA
jgi:hypothetical protein